MEHESAFLSLQQALQNLRQGQISIATFCTTWRSQQTLLSALPGQYATVLEDLLSRLEAGSLFTEESCSFSQIDLLATLDTWLEKARGRLSTI